MIQEKKQIKMEEEKNEASYLLDGKGKKVPPQ